MKWIVNAPDGYATNLKARAGTNLTLVNQGGSAAIAVAAATQAGNITTITPTNPIPNLQPGQAVTISGVLPAGYNGSFGPILSVNAATGAFTFSNPANNGAAASTAAGTATQGCDVYFDTNAVATRLNSSFPGATPDGTRIAAGGGQVQFTDAAIIWMRAAVQTTIEVQP